MQPVGLRTSKKAATRVALATAVLHHASGSGIESVSVQTVAAEVGVSARTFHNYFPSKEDALIYVVGVFLERLANLIESRPPGEPLGDLVEYALAETACASEAVPDQLVTLIRLLENEPMLAQHKHNDDLLGERKSRFATVLSCRGHSTELGLYERLVFGSALVTLRVALEVWSNGSTQTATFVHYWVRHSGSPKSGLSQPGR